MKNNTMREWFKNNLVSTLSLATLLTMAFLGKELQLRLFSDVESRIKAEAYIKALPHPETIARDRLLDSIQTANYLKKQNHRDSIMRSQHDAIKQLQEDQKNTHKLLNNIIKRLNTINNDAYDKKSTSINDSSNRSRSKNAYPPVFSYFGAGWSQDH